MKDEFLATLSHELRTPLNAILGWSQILRARAMSEAQLNQGLEDHRAKRPHADAAHRGPSRHESNHLRQDASGHPAGVAHRASSRRPSRPCRPSAEAKGIRLTKLLDPAAGPINGDPSRLQQVVWNLLSNAIKFTGKNGRVEIVLERVELPRRDHRCRLGYRDQAGVPAARVRSIPAGRRLRDEPRRGTRAGPFDRTAPGGAARGHGAGHESG